ncbi:MAG: hypothetical protein D3904_00580, partial [Candidatus Electrothrix sp. EH2]|nr:hypothetical protein [Candidatus Electrothrix sp. EH2]
MKKKTMKHPGPIPCSPCSFAALAVLLTLSAGISTPVYAQDKSTVNKKPLHKLEEVVVTATKSET